MQSFDMRNEMGRFYPPIFATTKGRDIAPKVEAGRVWRLISPNVLRLCAGGALKHGSFNPPLNSIKRTNDEHSRYPPLAQNRC